MSTKHEAHAIADQTVAALLVSGWRERTLAAGDPLIRVFHRDGFADCELRPMIREGLVRVGSRRVMSTSTEDTPAVLLGRREEIARALRWLEGPRTCWWVRPTEPVIGAEPIPADTSEVLCAALRATLLADGATERVSPRGDRRIATSDGFVLGRLAAIRQGGGAAVRIHKHRGRPLESPLVETTESTDEPYRITVRSEEQIAGAIELVRELVARGIVRRADAKKKRIKFGRARA